MTQVLLKLENISVQYGGVKALSGVSTYFVPGEIVALMGPNGAGKSTVLKAIFGLAPLSGGRVLWHGHPINPVPHEVVRRGIAFVPQGRQIFRQLSVRENLEIGGWILESKKEIKERITELLELFPALKAKINKTSGTLSGGQQQMLALARGLMVDPKVLLLDEPSLGLAPKLVKEVFAKIKEINEKRQITIVVVEHNLKSLLEIVNRAYLLDKGVVVAEGQPDHLTSSGLLEKVFIGQ